MTRLDLDYAYPFMSLALVIAIPRSVRFFGIFLIRQQIVGTALVMGRLIVITLIRRQSIGPCDDWAEPYRAMPVISEPVTFRSLFGRFNRKAPA